mmetsp:Transcript_24394/g.40254  ORF Transcript_24394/g.40254 Transcript_24394/m.40254 type:complete len:284 (+) Transcript_24394:85-936(+)|eukprot:scaffold13873_cov139-Skeletonema_menzelii.AAC.5
MTNQRQLSPRTVAALNHLRRLKPLDGYAAEIYNNFGKELIRLKRRNVSLHDEGFLDIVLYERRVIGIQILTSSGNVGRGLVLVNEDGNPCTSRDDSRITVNMTDVLTSNSAAASSSTSRSSSGSSAAYNAPPTNPLSNVDNENILQYGMMGLAALLVLKIVVNALSSLAFLLLPLLYFYASSNCPSSESFDAKKELKRVMRGAHLPEEQQPKGWVEQKLNRLAASISTELATSLGYEVRVTDYFGVARVSAVKVPVAGQEFYWIGIINRWQYIGQRELRSNND